MRGAPCGQLIAGVVPSVAAPARDRTHRTPGGAIPCSMDNGTKERQNGKVLAQHWETSPPDIVLIKP